jgi:peptidoglycan/xylan/chitin deacetylase (PgdA/CDA1 family)
VHAILRRGAAGTVALAVGTLVVMTCFAVLGWSESGLVSAPPSPSRVTPLGTAADSIPDNVVGHRWIIPVGRTWISVPILMYHYIQTPPSILKDRLGFNLSVSPSDFNAQMDWLSVHGYHPVTLNDLHVYFNGKQALPSKPVVITLDDGYDDLYTKAFPILQAHNFRAVAYIVSGFVGQPRYVTAAQVVEMSKGGIEIASHTVNHPNLANTSPPNVMYQLVTSKAWLEHLVKHPIVDFAYPSGKFDARVIAALSMSGYATAVTTMPGTYHSKADRYTWTRVRVSGGESLAAFVANLGPIEKPVLITEVVVERTVT